MLATMGLQSMAAAVAATMMGLGSLTTLMSQVSFQPLLCTS